MHRCPSLPIHLTLAPSEPLQGYRVVSVLSAKRCRGGHVTPLTHPPAMQEHVEGNSIESTEWVAFVLYSCCNHFIEALSHEDRMTMTHTGVKAALLAEYRQMPFSFKQHRRLIKAVANISLGRAHQLLSDIQNTRTIPDYLPASLKKALEKLRHSEQMRST